MRAVQFAAPIVWDHTKNVAAGMLECFGRCMMEKNWDKNVASGKIRGVNWQ